VERLEGVGDIAQEDQPEDDVLVLRRVDVLPELVGGFPELLLDGFLGDFFLGGFRHAALLQKFVRISDIPVRGKAHGNR
jgi:hypothetical protein